MLVFFCGYLTSTQDFFSSILVPIAEVRIMLKSVLSIYNPSCGNQTRLQSPLN